MLSHTVSAARERTGSHLGAGILHRDRGSHRVRTVGLLFFMRPSERSGVRQNAGCSSRVLANAATFWRTLLHKPDAFKKGKKERKRRSNRRTPRCVSVPYRQHENF